MVGSAGATMVCSSAERNIASMMPIMMAWIVARGRAARALVRFLGGVVHRARTMTERAGNSTAVAARLPCFALATVPSPLAGEGGSRGGNPSAIRVRGQCFGPNSDPSPALVRLRLHSGTLSRKVLGVVFPRDGS